MSRSPHADGLQTTPGARPEAARTPAQDGFFMPPEWAAHRGCWMLWPAEPETFPELEVAREAYAEVARAISRFEPLRMIANAADAAGARAHCGDGIDVLPMPIGDSWARDTGPTYLVDGRGNLAGVDWPFNAYGGLYDDYEEDAAIASRILEQGDVRRYTAPIFLEGGAVHTDGEGTLLTTASVVLNPNRNPGLTRREADEIFRETLGVEKVIWLEEALEVDTTDGHVDNLACFVRPGVVTALSEQDADDPHHEPLRENLRRLQREPDARGRQLQIIEIHQPARREFRGERLGLSYINYYIANGGIVCPSFDDPADEPAREALARAFPEREIVSAPGVEIVKGGGCIHCITQQEPRP
jgi:agmatine deiminase